MRWLIGFTAGGPVDTVARIMSQWLSERLGQQFVVENRAGSGGNIAAAAAITSPPDGYTLLFVAPNNAISTSLYKKLPYDFIRDTVPVASIMQLTNMMVVPRSAGQNRSGVHRLLQGQSRQGLVRLVGQRHLGPHVGGAVQGDDQDRDDPRTVSRIVGRDARPDFQQGAGDLRQPAVALEQSRGDAARARRHLAAALARCARHPGDCRDRAGIRVVGFYGISAPKGTPPEIIDILNKAVGEALKDPKLVARLADVGGIPKPMTPAEFGKLVADETEKWRKVVEFAGVSVD